MNNTVENNFFWICQGRPKWLQFTGKVGKDTEKAFAWPMAVKSIWTYRPVEIGQVFKKRDLDRYP